MQLTVMSDAECQALDKRELSQAKKLDAEIDKIIGDIANSGLQLAVKLYEMRRNDNFLKLGFKSMKEYVASKQAVAQRALSKQYISDLLGAGYVYQTLLDSRKSDNVGLLPSNSRQCMAMSKLSNLQIPRVWKAVVEKSQQADKPITAAMVSAVKRTMIPQERDIKKPTTSRRKCKSHDVAKVWDYDQCAQELWLWFIRWFAACRLSGKSCAEMKRILKNNNESFREYFEERRNCKSFELLLQVLDDPTAFEDRFQSAVTTGATEPPEQKSRADEARPESKKRNL